VGLLEMSPAHIVSFVGSLCFGHSASNTPLRGRDIIYVWVVNGRAAASVARLGQARFLTRRGPGRAQPSLAFVSLFSSLRTSLSRSSGLNGFDSTWSAPAAKASLA